MSIQLHIERLVLEGLTLGPGQERRLGAALTAELERLLAAGGLDDGLRAGGALPELGAGTVTLAGNEAAVALGQRIARAVYTGIGAGRGEGKR